MNNEIHNAGAAKLEDETALMPESMYITGTQVNFYFHCHRQLWLFSHQIRTEHESDLVLQGRIIHETSYEREKKEIEIDHLKLDFLDIREGVLHEIKKSDSWSEAHEWQVLYYLYFLKRKGIRDLRGELNYPVQRRTLPVILTPEKETKLGEILLDIGRVIDSKQVPPIRVKMSVCKKCSYYDFCYI